MARRVQPMANEWLIFERKDIQPGCRSAKLWMTATTKYWAESKIACLGKGLDLVIFSSDEWDKRGERINGEG
jgi:hypothetical protein